MKNCPHCNKELKLMAESKKMTDKGTTMTWKYRCPVDGCKFTYTESTVTSEGE